MRPVTAFDIVGDVHGCADELHTLLLQLGYAKSDDDGTWQAPSSRQLVFIGDLADRGPKNVLALTIAMDMVEDGAALWVPGNHDVQLQRWLEGADVPLLYGLDVTVQELARVTEGFRDRVRGTLQALPSHYVLDNGRLVVAHTGLPEALHGVESAEVRYLAAYGFLPGAADPPSDWTARHAWVASYAGEAAVVYGHTPQPRAAWVRNTIDIDTGCVYGGRLTALRWPEREIVEVPAQRAYAGPAVKKRPPAASTGDDPT
ncbi:MAG: metallophosphoesterase [Acidobacteria bacterium]|nr:metallophosphoesterase [Acidobacteriota bacterium]